MGGWRVGGDADARELSSQRRSQVLRQSAFSDSLDGKRKAKASGVATMSHERADAAYLPFVHSGSP